MVRLKSQLYGLPDCYSVLEEALKSWHHVIANEVVYVDQLFVGNDDPFACVTEINSDLHRWIKLDLRLGCEGKTNYSVIICPTGKRRILGGVAELQIDPGGLQGDSPMLVNIPKPMKSPELCQLVSVPCMVWLKRLDYVNGEAGNPPHGTLEQTLSIGVIDADDRKARTVVVRSASTQCESGSEVVEGAPQAGREVPGHECEVYRQRLEVEANHIFASFKIILGRERIGLRIIPIHELPELFFHQAKVMLCPTHLESGIEISRCGVGVDVG